MPNDYILRSDALFELHNYASGNDPSLIIAYRVDLCERIEKIPAADVEPVRHGRWVDYDDTERFVARCSLCNAVTDTRFPMHFCANCGAKMME